MIRLVRNIGSVLTERGGVLKIGVITFVALLGSVVGEYNGGFLYKNPDGAVILNLPQLILMILLGLLSSGLFIEIIRNRMNGNEKFLPDIDLGNAIFSAFRVIPFLFVWAIYFFITIRIAFWMCSALSKVNPGLVIAVAILFIIFLIILNLGLTPLYYLHLKDFRYRYVLSPIAALQIASLVALPSIGLFLAFLLLTLVAIVALSILLRFGNEMFTIAITAYAYFVINVAFCIRFSDMVNEKLKGTPYLNEFYGYAHNVVDLSDEN